MTQERRPAARDWRMGEIATSRTHRDNEPRDYEVFHSSDSGGSTLEGVLMPGVAINAEHSLMCSAVLAAIRVIGETISTLPLHVYRSLPEGGKEKDKSNPLYRLLHTQTNSWQSSFEFRELMNLHCCLYGSAFAEVVRIGNVVKELVPLHPSRVRVERVEGGRLRYTFTDPRTGQRTVYPQENIFHLKWLSSDGITAFSPVALARDAIKLARACELHGIGFFANSARPGVVLETEHSIPPEAQERLREAWQRVHRGGANNGVTAILPNGLKAHELGSTNTDSQYLELRNFQLLEIGRIFRVPPHLLGDLSRATFSNIEQQSMDFLQYSILPWIRRWESALQLALFADEEDTAAEFDVRGLLRADSPTRAQFYQTTMNLGIYSLNEVRELENLQPIEGGETRFVTLNVQTLDAAIAAAKKPAAEEPQPPSDDEQLLDGGEDAAEGEEDDAESKRSLESRDCGTGAGGFKAGNDCAKGDGSGGEGEHAKHGVSLPTKKSKLSISQTKAALSEMGYALGASSVSGKGNSSVVAYEVVGPGGDKQKFSAQELKDFVYKHAKKQSRNCGTGAGGFKAGNTCATGGVAGDTPEGVNFDIVKLLEKISSPDSEQGFSIDILTADQPSDGIMVSTFHNDTVRSVRIPVDSIAKAEGRDALLSFIVKNGHEFVGRPDRYLGGWKDGNEFYLDISTRFDPNNAAAALEEARVAGQLAVFNLATFKETYVQYADGDSRKPENWNTSFARAQKDAGADSGELSEHGRTTVRSRVLALLEARGYSQQESESIANELDEEIKNGQAGESRSSDTGVKAGSVPRVPQVGGSGGGASGPDDGPIVVQGLSRGVPRALQLGDHTRKRPFDPPHRAGDVERAMPADDCGTGAGGFKAGNTCATGKSSEVAYTAIVDLLTINDKNPEHREIIKNVREAAVRFGMFFPFSGDAFAKNVDELVVYSTNKEVGEAVYGKGFTRTIGGCYARTQVDFAGNATLHLGPDKETYSHEFAHALDANHYFSNTDSWKNAWQNEIVGGGHITKYAATSPSEGFAEFVRALVAGPPKEIRANMPQCYAAIEQHFWKK